MPDPPTSTHLQPGHIHHDRLGPTLHTQPPAPPPHNPKPLTTPRRQSSGRACDAAPESRPQQPLVAVPGPDPP
ncbi:hypothetical protein I547_3910 [Mycobacterium kansasii 824]|nr:hypothetical protein I547_3910 [Mycobacterium kansasii 824]